MSNQNITNSSQGSPQNSPSGRDTEQNRQTQGSSSSDSQGATTFGSRIIGGERDPSGAIERFLWFCAGADASILDRCPRSERVKYQGLGGIVLATGILAWVSMFFAIKTIFFNDEKTTSLIQDGQGFYAWLVPSSIGLIWAMIIFNLDRFIVSSTGKGDGTDRITPSEFKNAVPRIIMAFVIAISISAPLEIKLFEDEILKQFEEENAKKERNQKMDYVGAFSNEIKEFQERVDQLVKDKKNHTSRLGTFKARIDYEIRNGGCKDKCNEFKALVAQEEAEIKNIDDQIKINQENIDTKNKEINEKLTEYKETIKRTPGLLERIILLEKLPDGSWAVWIIRLLFIVVECGPIFFKMMITRGLYDHFKQYNDEMRLADNDIFRDSRIQIGPNQHASVETFYVFGTPFIRQREAQLRVQEQQSINDEIMRQWQKFLAQQVKLNPEEFNIKNNVTTSATVSTKDSVSEAGTENPNPTNTETPGSSTTETPNPTNTETPGSSTTETPNPTNTETPGSSTTETPNPTNTETPGSSTTETPNPTNTETPGSSTTETPSPTNTETPGSSTTETPNPTNTETPGSSTTETPNPTNTETTTEPDTEYVGIPEGYQPPD